MLQQKSRSRMPKILIMHNNNICAYGSGARALPDRKCDFMIKFDQFPSGSVSLITVLFGAHPVERILVAAHDLCEAHV